ncbi:MAG: biotin/lipoyl-containing protein [Kofleriaceae bacterium]
MKRELVVTVGGVEKTVVVDGPLPDGRFRVTIDGSERLVDGRAVHPGTWSLVLDGRNFVVDLDRRGKSDGSIAASVGSSNVMLTVEDALHKRLASAASPRAAARGESIRAPIAGKVVKVFVAPGDQVTPGTAVIVLEAMKMENELVAERGGTVAAVTKTAGQAVDTGDLLIELT